MMEEEVLALKGLRTDGKRVEVEEEGSRAIFTAVVQDVILVLEEGLGPMRRRIIGGKHQIWHTAVRQWPTWNSVDLPERQASQELHVDRMHLGWNVLGGGKGGWRLSHQV
jgi:hypothetical protein